jgi:hypothetical protein
MAAADTALNLSAPTNGCRNTSLHRSRAAKRESVAPVPTEPRTLVIGTGTLFAEKVEKQVVTLRRVSKIRGDLAVTEMRQAALSVRQGRMSTALGSAFRPTTSSASSRSLLHAARPAGTDAPTAGDDGAEPTAGAEVQDSSAPGTYAYVATVSRQRVAMNPHRSAPTTRRTSVGPAWSAMDSPAEASGCAP